MKAIVLNAGYGGRLRPTTDELPKCLLPVDEDRPVLEVQLCTLARCGIRHVTMMIGYGAEKIEYFLATHPIPSLTVETRFNPFFATTNTAVTCWLGSGGPEFTALGRLWRLGVPVPYPVQLQGTELLLEYLDEPSANLDSEGDVALLSCISDLKQRGATVVMISHRPNTFGVVDKLLVMKDGTAEAFGPRNDVIALVFSSR